MKNLIVFFYIASLMLCSCSYLEKATTNAINQSGQVMVDKTIRKVQTKVEAKVDKTISNIVKPSTPPKRLSETQKVDSLAQIK